MAHQLFDRVQVTATANTTVSFTLGAAVVGYRAFSVLANGDTTYYGAFDGTNWEVGVGTYSTTGPTLTRTTILSSSNSGSAVTFTGTPLYVWIDYPAAEAVYQDLTNTAYAPQFAVSNGLILNNKTIGTSYTLPTGYNASSVGPVTVSGGVVITVPSGSRWLVL